MCGSVPLVGECGITDAFSGVFKLLTILCDVRACVFDTSIWSLRLSGSMHDATPQAGNSAITDTFACPRADTTVSDIVAYLQPSTPT